MSERRARTTGEWGRIGRRLGVWTAALALAGVLGSAGVWALDTRYARADEAVRKVDLHKALQEAMQASIRPLEEEQVRTRAAVEEIRCLLTGGRWILGACLGTGGGPSWTPKGTAPVDAGAPAEVP